MFNFSLPNAVIPSPRYAKSISKWAWSVCFLAHNNSSHTDTHTQTNLFTQTHKQQCQQLVSVFVYALRS